MTPGGREPPAVSAERAALTVVPASTTCSRPARVIRSCWLDTVYSLVVGLMTGRTGYPMLSGRKPAARVSIPGAIKVSGGRDDHRGSSGPLGILGPLGASG